MQKLQVYGHPRLPSMGTILRKGAFLRVGSMNCQRSRTPGSVLAAAWRRCCTPAGRCCEQSCRYVVERLPVRKAQDVVEVPSGVFRVAAGVRPADRGDGPPPAERLLRAYAVCAASVNAPMKTRSTLSGNSFSRSSNPV